MSTVDVTLGAVYQHYKGKKYRVHRLVRHSETLEELVFYETLYQCEMGNFWVRPKTIFLESVEVDGEWRPRFKLVDEE